MEQISKYVSLQEATHTGTKLSNTPSQEHLLNMKYVATNIFDRVRDYFKKPIGINSFYRSQAVNKAVGGAPTSQHTYGEAIDIDGKKYGGVSNSEIFHFIKDNLDFDQLIWEFGTASEPAWVHVSLKSGLNRRQILRAVKQGGKTVYMPFR